MVVGDADILTVVLSSLGRDEDSTVGTFVSIERHSSGIFEDRHMIHLLRTDKTHVTLHTIDKDERCAGAQTLQSAHIECGVLLEVGPRSVHISVGDDRDCGRRLCAGEVLIGAHFDDLISEIDAKAVLLCRCGQSDANEQ